MQQASEDQRISGFTFQGYDYNDEGSTAWVLPDGAEEFTEIIGLDPRKLIGLVVGEPVILAMRDGGETSGLRTSLVVGIERDPDSLLAKRLAWEQANPRPPQLRAAEEMIVKGLAGLGHHQQYQSTVADGFTIATGELLITVKHHPPVEGARKPPAALTDGIKALPRVDKL